MFVTTKTLILYYDNSHNHEEFINYICEFNPIFNSIK
jgi:hypothetical protein